jgi:hypothetical protein
MREGGEESEGGKRGKGGKEKYSSINYITCSRLILAPLPYEGRGVGGLGLFRLLTDKKISEDRLNNNLNVFLSHSQ